MDTAQRHDIGQGLMADLWSSTDPMTPTAPGGISILAFHGGGGVDGNPAMMAPFLRLLTQGGLATHPICVTVPQYRTLNRDRAVFDDMRADAARALVWVQGQLPEDGRLFVLGASFGGLLALDAVMGAPAAVQEAVSGLILLNPVTDTGPEGFANRVLTPVVHTALSPQIRYAGHPLTGRLRCLIAHGGRDEVVPIAQARRFAALWPKEQCRFRGFPDAGHGFFNKPAQAATVAQDVRRFVGLPDATQASESANKSPAKPAAAKKPAAKGGRLLPEGACMAYGIGAQKAGTSWLFDCLSQSDDCHSLPTKELHYFDALYDKGEAGHMTDRLAQLRRTVAEMTEKVDPANRARLRRARLLVDRLSIHATTPGDHRPYVEHLLTGYDGQRIICDFTPSYSVLDSDAFAQMDSIRPGAVHLHSARPGRAAVVADPHVQQRQGQEAVRCRLSGQMHRARARVAGPAQPGPHSACRLRPHHDRARGGSACRAHPLCLLRGSVHPRQREPHLRLSGHCPGDGAGRQAGQPGAQHQPAARAGRATGRSAGPAIHRGDGPIW